MLHFDRVVSHKMVKKNHLPRGGEEISDCCKNGSLTGQALELSSGLHGSDHSYRESWDGPYLEYDSSNGPHPHLSQLQRQSG